MRFQPMALRYVSDRKPSNVRNGAIRTGKAIITATMVAGTDNSTIITRFSVPSSITVAIPTDT